MKTKMMVKRYGSTVAVFALVSAGAWLALPNGGDGKDDGTDLVPVLVVTKAVAGGSSAADLESAVAVRRIAEADLPDGALSEKEDIPEGVVAYDHVAGQQLLVTSFADDPVAAVGEGRVAVSVRVDSQRWVGPYTTTGSVVDVYSLEDTGATKISGGAVILGSPATEDLTPKQDSIVTLAVRQETLQAVLIAANENRLWMVGS